MTMSLDAAELPGQGRILLAFSGGPDSVCLAALLAKANLSRPVLAVHVDHGLDPNSAQRAAQAEQIVTRLGLACQQLKVNPDPQLGGPEASARKARYHALAEMMGTDQLLLTAHHADDQVETILMRLLRGAGPDGLSGIPAQRRFGPGWLARPLLAWRRKQIIDWLQARELPWIEDPSNQDLSLDRNFLRHRVMPMLRERWPGVDGSIQRSGRLNQGAAEALQEIGNDDLSNCQVDQHRVRLESLARLSRFRQGELLRHWCHRAGLPAPPGRQLDEFLDQLRSSAADRQPELCWLSHRIIRHGSLLWLLGRQTETPAASIAWDGLKTLQLPNDLGRLELRSKQPCHEQLEVRFGTHPSERIRLPGRDHHHAIKQLMNEAGVPPWQRPLWPRLWQGDRLIAVGQRWIDADFQAWLEKQNGKLSWQAPFPTNFTER